MPVSDEEFNKALNLLAVAYEALEAVENDYLEGCIETLGQADDHWWAIGLNNAGIWHLLTENWSRMHAQDVAWAKEIIEHPWRADLLHLVGKRKARVLAIAKDIVNERKLSIEQDMKGIARRMLDSAVLPAEKHLAQERIREMQKVSHTWDMDAK
jgi:hypothetical protein